MLETSQPVLQQALTLPAQDRAELAERLLATLGEPGSDEYELPADLLKAYHHLLDKKFAEGLRPEEERELDRVGAQLDQADMDSPMEREIDARAKTEHGRRMSSLGNVLSELRSLREP